MVIIVDVLCGSVFLWTQLASWNFVLNGVCVALGKICFSDVSSWKLQIYSQLCYFHDYYLSFYSSSTCLLLLPCTFLPSPQSFTHTTPTTFMSTDHLVSLDNPTPTDFLQNLLVLCLQDVINCSAFLFNFSILS